MLRGVLEGGYHALVSSEVGTLPRCISHVRHPTKNHKILPGLKYFVCKKHKGEMLSTKCTNVDINCVRGKGRLQSRFLGITTHKSSFRRRQAHPRHLRASLYEHCRVRSYHTFVMSLKLGKSQFYPGAAHSMYCR